MNVNRSYKNSFTIKKIRSKLYPAETMTDANYADDLALLTNTPVHSSFPVAQPGASSRRH